MGDDSTKTIIKVVVLAGAGLALYWWLQKSGYWAQWFGPAVPVLPVGAPVQTPITQPVQTPVTPAQPLASTPSGIPANYGQAAAAMTTAASGPQNFDQWSWYWQNSPTFSGAPAGYGTNGSISGPLIDAMIAAGGGDRSALITAQQWVALLWGQQQKGVSGLFGLPVPMTPHYGWVN